MLTDEDIMEKLKVSPSKLRRLRLGYSLPFFKVGYAIRYRQSEVEEWINENRGYHKLKENPHDKQKNK